MSARSGASANAPVSMWQIWMMAEADHASGEQAFRCRDATMEARVGGRRVGLGVHAADSPGLFASNA